MFVAGFSVKVATPESAPTPSPEGLRWEKANRGIPVTWAVNDANRPDDIDPGGLRAAVLVAVDIWTGVVDNNITFVEVALHEAPDVLVEWGAIDGDNNVLGQALLPTTGSDIGVCGPCGDITMDIADGNSQNFLEKVITHEWGHGALGIGHSGLTDGANIMDSALTNLSLEPGPFDIAEARRRYPS